MAGFGSWFGRRIVRADVRDTEVVSSTGTSVHRFGEFLADSHLGRWFWIVASVSQLALFAALPALTAWGIRERSDLDRGDPVRVGVVVLVTLASWWCALLWQGSVRAMLRHRAAPRRAWDDDEEPGQPLTTR